jgi:hypothetical protein
MVVIRANLKLDADIGKIDVTLKLKTKFKETLLDNVFNDGGCIFAPKNTTYGMTNMLTGLFSACQGIARSHTNHALSFIHDIYFREEA